ncbi:hypothetical protein QZH41_018052 [Actinostola sp. cb2023]|nr:hypothetical protein QZH41_018052 [Actinostola sp. cb2023]
MNTYSTASAVTVISWSRSLKNLPKLTMKDVEAFVKTEKSPKSGLVKGYKFFCEGFIKDFEVGTSEGDDLVHVRSRCFKSLRKSEDPHYIKVC